MTSELPFWKTKTLEEMTQDEWESLCDGCAKCCLHKLQDEETEEVYYTKVACRYLEEDSCHCSVYQTREQYVPECLWVTPEIARQEQWLPATCAYRLLAQGEDLPHWHPLVAGNDKQMVQVGISIKGRFLSEEFVHPDGLDEHIIHWVE